MIALLTALAMADPCGMVPPLDLVGAQVHRVERQRTWVMHRNGMQVIGLRPGFEGNASQFGMLIPFPAPPTMHKLPDDFFAHLEAAIDPPTVQLHVLSPAEGLPGIGAGMANESATSKGERGLTFDEVVVVSTEAVGMYQVAVLQAGSSGALARWMAEHRFRFPKGMEAVVDDYLGQGWSMVAVRANLGAADHTAPRPGLTSVMSASQRRDFGGYVQGMVFRFPSERVVIPMRLSVFNGPADNVVYVLSDERSKLMRVPENHVTRQISGHDLLHTLTHPVALNTRRGAVSDLSATAQQQLDLALQPKAWTGVAAKQITADLLATSGHEGSVEVQRKRLLNTSEGFGLRGREVQVAIDDATPMPSDGLNALGGMWLSVIEGHFDATLLADENLTTEPWTLDAPRSRSDTLSNKDPRLTLRIR